MNLPFCKMCRISDVCEKNHDVFESETGNKRIPSIEYCQKQHEHVDIEIKDFYKNVMINSLDNPSCLYPIFPELKEDIEIVEKEWLEVNTPEEKEFTPFGQLPFSITLMMTEKCNLACEYCYQRFAGNMKAKSMSKEMVNKVIDRYLTAEIIQRHKEIHWDLIGGEVFAEFELLKYTVQRIICGYRKLGVCTKKIMISLCTNGTLFDEEKRKWCEEIRDTIGWFDIGISLDGVKECHDLCRNNSFDRIMSSWDWWRENFPQCATKGTISPENLKYLFQNVKFYIEEAKLPQFYINPTFEGPWSDEDAELYGEELIKCAEFFLYEHPEFDLMKDSNLLMHVNIDMPLDMKQNWCGCGIHMRAVDNDGTIYPCLRGATSRLCPIGHIDNKPCEDRNKLVPFYFYTTHNDNEECASCDIRSSCPSCVMQWIEDTGDLFMRSQKMCKMTRVRHKVSQWYWEEKKRIDAEKQNDNSME